MTTQSHAEPSTLWATLAALAAPVARMIRGTANPIERGGRTQSLGASAQARLTAVGEISRATHHLQAAQRFVRAGERGAARHELQKVEAALLRLRSYWLAPQAPVVPTPLDPRPPGLPGAAPEFACRTPSARVQSFPQEGSDGRLMALAQTPMAGMAGGGAGAPVAVRDWSGSRYVVRVPYT
jgi:hypothetical protein